MCDYKYLLKIAFRSKVDIEQPKFVVQLRPQLMDIQEGDDVHMECRVSPSTDPHLQILWYFNQQLLSNNKRFTMVHDFAYVSLDIKHVIPKDSGMYTCRAVNEKGEASTMCDFNITSRLEKNFMLYFLYYTTIT